MIMCCYPSEILNFHQELTENQMKSFKLLSGVDGKPNEITFGTLTLINLEHSMIAKKTSIVASVNSCVS